MTLYWYKGYSPHTSIILQYITIFSFIHKTGHYPSLSNLYICRIILHLSHNWSSPQKRHLSSYSLLCSQPLGLSLANTRGSLIIHWINEIVSQLFLYYYLWYLQQTAGNQVSFSVGCTLLSIPHPTRL